MAITALDTATGSVVFPFDQGCTSATCRDPRCGAALMAVREVKAEDLVIRRSHWRHKVRSRCAARRESRGGETLWHTDWKMRCSDIERMEHHIVRETSKGRGSVRVADVLTKFGWVIEFQHSAISTRVVRGRERHYGGRVLWIVDCASSSNPNGDFTIEGDHVRWHAARDWVLASQCLVGVDTGSEILVLPTNFAAQLVGKHREQIRGESVIRYSYQRFTDEWINGDAHPLGDKFVSSWTLERRAKAKSREAARRDELVIEQSWRRAAYGNSVCSFSGDRKRLVWISDALIEVTMCSADYCISAASFDGWCHAHRPIVEKP